MTDEKVSTTNQYPFVSGSSLAREAKDFTDLQQQAHEARKQARREYVELMREGWRRKHGWRNR